MSYMSNRCYSCGAGDPNAPCPNSRPDRMPHTVCQCPSYQNSQQMTLKMDALEEAWALMKAKKDAPNYRHASKSEQAAGKICGTCKAWDDSATEDPQTGYCKWYDFNCNRDHTCDAWVGKKK